MPFTFNFGGFNFEGFNPANAPGPGSEGAAPPPRREHKPRKPIGTPLTRVLINLAVTLLFAAGYFYVELPALNFHDEEFYAFIFLLCAIYCVSASASILSTPFT